MAGQCESASGAAGGGGGHLAIAEAGADAAHDILCIHLAVLIRKMGQLSSLGPHINVLGRRVLLQCHVVPLMEQTQNIVPVMSLQRVLTQHDLANAHRLCLLKARRPRHCTCLQG